MTHVAALAEVLARASVADGFLQVDEPERLWCLAVDLPIGAARGAMLGHELRSPLAPILTAVEVLARHPSVP